MCGIAGMIKSDQRPVERERLLAMTETLAARGPDAQGIWLEGAVGLGHRRLSIIDLSERGNQPMTSEDGSLTIVFNGEIYNYQTLREELEKQGTVFHSRSDTEVLLQLYRRDGTAMLKRLRGMFAFAVWDKSIGCLFFARDCLGKKPFYYRADSDGFSFASEIKGLLKLKSAAPDWSAVRLFFGLQYIPAPLSGFEGIASLPPASYGIYQAGKLKIETYDRFERTPKFDGTFEEAAQELRLRLEEAVKLRLVSDVPVGAFLSGGVDSSAVVALMARQSKTKFKTFTMGFPSLGFDEREAAAKLAAQLGTEHHSFEARPANLEQLVDELVNLYDAPYADSSALPTWLLARETKQHVKVVLTGDGGDESFGGYRRYQAFMRALAWHRLTNGVGDSFAAGFAEAIGSGLRDPRFVRFGRLLRALKISPAEAYSSLFTGSYFTHEDERKLLRQDFCQATEEASAQAFVRQAYPAGSGLEGALAFDLNSYLPDDLNVKMDRATMAWGLEARSPLLDQEVVRFAVRLPLSYRLKRGKSKLVLRAAIRDLVPSEVLSRPKRGFQVPLAVWFRSEARPLFTERCLGTTSPLSRICEPREIERLLIENDRGFDHGNRLWMLLVLSTWLRRTSKG